jgi:predicted DCC family thiol-disulfide oxidoreductase YuxK
MTVTTADGAMDVDQSEVRGGQPEDLTALQPLVIYDGDCIFCASYVKMYRARKSLGDFRLLDARTIRPDLRSELMRRYDLNEGMLFVEGGVVYYGADAVHALALVTSGSGLFNKVNGAIFRSKALSRLLYPVLKAGRRLTLFLRGKSMIAP